MKNRVFDKLFAVTAVKERPTEMECQLRHSSAIREKLDRSREKLEDFVAAHPAIGLGAAVSFGLLLGWWIKRK